MKQEKVTRRSRKHRETEVQEPVPDVKDEELAEQTDELLEEIACCLAEAAVTDEEKGLKAQAKAEWEANEVARLNQVKNDRNNAKVRECLERLGEACTSNENVMPILIQAVKEYATLQECCDVYRKVFGRYRDPGIF